MNEDASQVRTTLPCPDWCVLPTGHGFHSLTHEGLLMRCHEGADHSTAGVAIALITDETALSDNGPVDSLTVPTVYVCSDDTTLGRQDGPSLRRIAAALLDAADELDGITG